MTVVVQQDQITQMARPVVEGLGFELVAVQVARAGKRQIVRLFADRPDGGIVLDECAQISRALAAAFDELPGTDGPYTLEVSSPGLEYRCSTVRDLQRYRGWSMTLQLADGRQISGVLESANEEQVMLASGESVPRAQVRYGTRNY